MATERQKRVAQLILESNGKSISQAMKEAGYPSSTSKNPQQLTRSRGWHELMEKYLPDYELVKVHKEGLKATKIVTSQTEPDYTVPDYAVRHKYLETGYKIKNKISDDSQFPPQRHLHVHIDLKQLTAQQIEKFAQTGELE